MLQAFDLHNLAGWAPVVSWFLNIVLLFALWAQRALIKEVAGKAVGDAINAFKEELQKDLGSLNDKFGKHEGKLTDHDRRLIKAEGRITEIRDDIAKLPTAADVARIEGKLDGMTQMLSRTEAVVERMESYFLEQGVKGRG